MINSLRISMQINSITVRLIILIEISFKFTLSFSFFSKILYINLKISINTKKINKTQMQLRFKKYRKFRQQFNYIYKKAFLNHRSRRIRRENKKHTIQ